MRIMGRDVDIIFHASQHLFCDSLANMYNPEYRYLTLISSLNKNFLASNRQLINKNYMYMMKEWHQLLFDRQSF